MRQLLQVKGKERRYIQEMEITSGKQGFFLLSCLPKGSVSFLLCINHEIERRGSAGQKQKCDLLFSFCFLFCSIASFDLLLCLHFSEDGCFPGIARKGGKANLSLHRRTAGGGRGLSTYQIQQLPKQDCFYSYKTKIGSLFLKAIKAKQDCFYKGLVLKSIKILLFGQVLIVLLQNKSKTYIQTYFADLWILARYNTFPI